MTEDVIKAPPLHLLLGEARVAFALGRYWLKGLNTAGLPRGRGEPVVVIPGFGIDDRHTRPLREALSELGYQVYGWGAGTNRGMNSAVRERLVAMLADLHERHGHPVTLIGWSLGGVFARELAREHRERVYHVFTLGSPINGHPNANNVSTLFALFNPKARGEPDMEAFRRRAKAPPVPCTAIHTRSDGIVAWRCSREEPGVLTDNVEVHGTHLGLACNEEVVAAIAERLARQARINDERT